MRIIIVGGGTTGYHLLKRLRESGFKTTLIEQNHIRCRQIAEDLDIQVILGDGKDNEVLKDAGIRKADTLIAVTGSDEENLVICQTVKDYYPAIKTIARIKNPSNSEVYRTLGIDHTICLTEAIINLAKQ